MFLSFQNPLEKWEGGKYAGGSRPSCFSFAQNYEYFKLFVDTKFFKILFSEPVLESKNAATTHLQKGKV